MKNTVVLGATIAGACLLFGLAEPAQADMSMTQFGDLHDLGDYFDNTWRRVDSSDKSSPWQVADGSHQDGKAKCYGLFERAAKDGLKDTDMFKVRNDGPDWLKGEVSIGDMKPVCDRVQRMVNVKLWEKWAVFAMQELGKEGGGDIKFAENCLSRYDDMLKKGIAADSSVVPRKVNDASGTAVEWKGTVKEVRVKYCDAGLKKAQEEQAKRDAPYKKVMKGEKLETALTYRGVFLAGGSVTEDPAVMAKANVWFVDTEPSEVCANGMQKHVIHRFEFAGNKLAKSTNIDTCGVPRANNFQ